MIQVLLNGTAYPENYLSWKERKETISRSEIFKGVIMTQSLDLQFIGSAADYIIGLDSASDVAASCTVNIQNWDNIEGWTDIFVGLLDFTSIKIDNKDIKKVTISAHDSGMAKKLIERVELDIPYDKLSTIDNVGFTAFADEYKTVQVDGIEVVGTNIPSVVVEGISRDSDGSTRNVILAINSDANSTRFKDVSLRAYGGTQLTGSINAGDCYYLAAENTRLVIDYSIVYDFGSNLSTNPNEWEFYMRVYKVTFDSEFAQTGIDMLDEVEHFDEVYDQTFAGTLTLDLVANEGIVFYVYRWAQNVFSNQDCYVEIKENSSITTTYSELAPATPCELVPPFEAFTRTVQAITGEALAVDSSYFGRTDSPVVYSSDGEGSLLFLTNGKLLRQFPKSFNLKKASQLTFSLKELFENISKITPIGAGIRNGKLYIDKLENFYLNEVSVEITADMMEVDTFEISKDMEMYFNQIEIGSEYEQPEEISGLEEYNSKQTYATPILNDNKLELITTYIYAAYPFEFTRRKKYTDQETSDYKYDNNNFVLKVLRDGSDFIQHNGEGFDTINGLDSVTHYINLDITPKRNLLRHGWFINSGLRGYQGGKLIYNKSDIVTDLETQKSTEANLISECTDVLISTLDSPKFTGRMVRFSAPINASTFALIKANPYALIKYYNPLTASFGYGYIKEVSSSIIDKTTNIELYETIVTIEGESLRLLQDGSFRLLEDGGYRVLE